MSKPKQEFFSSRLGIVLSMIGVAVGAGNIWRFSRIVAQNGGGSFVVAWVIFLFIWSIPLIIAEIALGKKARKAPIGALAKIGGRKMGWMGAFVAVVATGIMCYYSVIVGWGLRYFFYGVSGTLAKTEDFHSLWTNFSTSAQPLIFHILTLVVGCFIILKGVVRGIERTNKILIPILLLIIFIIFVRALTLPGAMGGIKYFYTPVWSDLLNYRIWIEALTQNAWDTGAGWGLLLVYAGYMHRRESVVVNGCLTAFSNNAVSLIMGMTIFATVFALESDFGIQQLISGEGSTQVGIAFIFLPKLFNQLPGGPLVHSSFASLFFLAFYFAALSSTISMIQLTSQTIAELGVEKKSAILFTGILALLVGIPSAISITFLENQDTVWGLGLLLSGLFIAISVISYGVNRFREDAINISKQDFKIKKFYNAFIMCVIPAQAIVLISWFFYHIICCVDSEGWWNPLRPFSAGTIIMQWGVCITVFIVFNKWLVKKTLKKY